MFITVVHTTWALTLYGYVTISCCMSIVIFLYVYFQVISNENVTSVKENEFILMGSESTINSSSWKESAWHLDKIGQVTMLNNTNTTLTGKGVDVYILDSGVHYEHKEFGGRALYAGCDPIDKLYHQNQAGRDCEGHGTHVAGLVGGSGLGVANGVTLFSVRILNCGLEATEASLLHGLMCVVNHRKHRNGTHAIINLSISGSQSSLAVNNSLQLALDNDIIIIASAGNGDTNFRLVSYDSCKAYPAGYPGVINVGANDIHNNALMGEFDSKIHFTNMGKCLDVFAPGYKIFSSDTCPFLPCDNDNDECTSRKTYDNTCKSVRSGTSQSAPIVSGAVALLLEKCPGLKHTEVKNMLRHVLSTSKVQFCKAFKYLRKSSGSLLDIIVTVMNTCDRLLYIGSLSNMNHCGIFNGLPLL